MIYFTSKRLVFRDWNENDLFEFRKMNQDKDVMEFFQKTLDNNETDLFYNRILDEFKQKGFGLYAVETKDLSEFIGFIGFHQAIFPSFFTPCIEIGWRLKKSAWNKGYTTEGAKACLQYAKNNLSLKEVYSFTSKINIRSINVMQKIGMTKITEFLHPNINENDPLCNHVLYKINI